MTRHSLFYINYDIIYSQSQKKQIQEGTEHHKKALEYDPTNHLCLLDYLKALLHSPETNGPEFESRIRDTLSTDCEFFSVQKQSITSSLYLINGVYYLYKNEPQRTCENWGKMKHFGSIQDLCFDLNVSNEYFLFSIHLSKLTNQL